MALFELGDVVAMPAALEKIEEDSIFTGVACRHRVSAGGAEPSPGSR